MRKTIVTVIAACLACVVAAQSPAELTRQVRETDFRFMEALGNGDHKTLDEILDKNAVVVTSAGKVGPRDHMINAVRTGATRVTRIEIEHESVTMHGDTAVVSERTHSRGLARGEKIDNWLQILRVYMRKDGKWLLISYQSTRILPAKK
jgi:ketosteroid isomerase-like protein